MSQSARLDQAVAWRPVLRALFGGRRRALLTGAALALATAAMGIGLLGVAGWFITATAVAGLHVAAATVFDVFSPSAGIRLLAIGRTASRYGERLTTHDATLGVLARLRETLFRAWAHPEAAPTLRLHPARALFRLTGDLQALESIYLRWAVPVVAVAGGACLVAVVAGFRSAALGLAVLVALLAAGGGCAAWLAARALRPAVQRTVAVERLRARTVDLVAGQADLVMAGRLEAQRALVRGADARIVQADRALHRLEARAVLFQGLANALLPAGMLLATGWLVDRQRLDAPGAALLLLAVLAATEGFAALRRGALDAGRTLLAVRRLGPGLAPMQAPPTQHGMPLTGRAVQVRGMRVAAAGSTLLEVPSLDIATGERVALVGASGAGKSTLLAALVAERPLAAGSVAAVSASWLPQQGALFQDTVRDNLLLANPAASDAMLGDALAAAQLREDVARWPQGLATALGEGGLGVSGGQARRLGVAQLLLHTPAQPLWLLDEPTEGLDAPRAHALLAALDDAAAGRTVVIATHLQREAAFATRLLCMEHGRIVRDVRRGEAGYAAVLASLRSHHPAAGPQVAAAGAAAAATPRHD